MNVICGNETVGKIYQTMRQILTQTFQPWAKSIKPLLISISHGTEIGPTSVKPWT